MNPFDELVFKILSDSKRRSFSELSSIVGFPHNTLRLHLESLVNGGQLSKGNSRKAEDNARQTSIHCNTASSTT